MAKSFKNYLSGQIGENLVAAELGRRGIVASILSGNMPDVDILAFRAGKSIGIQVKAFKTGSVSVNLADYLHIDLIDTVQHVRGIREASNPDLIYVIVKIGNMIGDDKFYVLRRLDIQKLLENGHIKYLERHDGIRPRNPSSMHAAYGEKALESYLGNWALIECALPAAAEGMAPNT